MDPGILRLGVDVDLQSNGGATGFDLYQGRGVDVLVLQDDESQDINQLALLQHGQKLGEKWGVLLYGQERDWARIVGVRGGELVRGKACFNEAPSGRDDVW